MRPLDHRAYGLTIRSALELPELLPASAPGDPDLSITVGPAASVQWATSGATVAAADDFVTAPGGGFVMRVAGVAEYWVRRRGSEIEVSPAEGADPAAVRLYLLGSALGMALHQRGLLALHGATVLHPRGATLILGDSGHGKSTLAAALGQTGDAAILGDDVMALWPRPGGGARVWPGSGMLKLWSDAVEALGGSPAALDAVGARLEKYFVPNRKAARDAPVAVYEVMVLEAIEDGPPSVVPLTGLAAIRAIAENTYRPEYVPLLGREAAHFRHCAELAGSLPVVRLCRPWAIGRLGETAEMLARRWTPEGAAGATP